MLIIPAIDLKDGRCVRLTQGRKTDVKVYDADPVEMAERLELAGAQMIHVVDLDGAFAGRESPNRQIAREIIASLKIPVQFGGGLRSLDDIRQMIDAGAARVVIGTLAVESPEKVAEIAHRFGSRVCVGIDARGGEVTVRGWEKKAKVSAIDLARRVAAEGIGRIVYTDVARDGMLTGANVEETVTIARESGLRVTASGGISSLEDIRKLIDEKEPLVDSVIIGKALYESRFTLPEALQIASQR